MHARTIAALSATLAGALVATADAGESTAQHVWQSDVRVRALELTSNDPGSMITARVVVASDGDDARAVRLEVMLPVGVAVVQMPAGCHASPGPVMSLSARVTCALGDVPARESRVISIATTGAPVRRERLRFGAFVFSDTPDPVPANNFAERVVPSVRR